MTASAPSPGPATDPSGADLPPVDSPWLTRLADGTVKQTNPWTGTQVWTVPGRSHRPITAARTGVDDPDAGVRVGTESYCAFCEARYRQTPPERWRVTGSAQAGWTRRSAVPVAELGETTAAFRVVPNLFPVLPQTYWAANHGQQPSPQARARHAEYTATAAGAAHVQAVLQTRMRASGRDPSEVDLLRPADRSAAELSLFASSHDLVISGPHLAPGARDLSDLAGSASLGARSHEQFVAVTVDATREVYAENPAARYVAVFQNWLRPAGASFDHLHKQLVAIDEWGSGIEREVAAVRAEPGLAHQVLAQTQRLGLVIAANDEAVLYAGIGNRYPGVEVMLRTPVRRPWELSAAQRRSLSDLLHAAHVATGVEVACNEEWHHTPVGAPVAIPLRVVLKWRLSTLAGFEGGTKVNLNTLDPWTVAALARDRLDAVREPIRGPAAAGRHTP